MSSFWSAFHAQLVRSVHRHSSQQQFSRLFPPDAQVHRFRDPAHLLGWLHGRTGTPKNKNTVLHHLLVAAGEDTAAGKLAVELLILALWPGLCTIRRRLRGFASAVGLEADLPGRLTIGIRTADPKAVRRVAATLLRNLERDLRRSWVAEARITGNATVLDEQHQMLNAPEPDQSVELARRLQDTLGEDGALLAGVHLFGFSQKEAAQQIGISHEAARKRCQRAMAQLRKQYDA